MTQRVWVVGVARGGVIRMAYRLAFASLVASALSFSTLAVADCSVQFADGTAPRALSAPATDRPHLLCFSAYAVLESGGTRTAVWSAEALTRDKVAAARTLTRDNTFHAEDALAHGERAELDDYSRSGWDRGHMTPSGDMPDVQSQAESFSLANMVPQAPRNNRRLWEHIEASTRRLASSTGEVYVVTGPGYTTAQPNWLNGRVRIPDLIWKAVYVPARGAAAYLVRNDSGSDYSVVSIAEITRVTGVDPFPSLDAAQRETALALPAPTPHQGEGHDKEVAEVALLKRPTDQMQVAARDTGGETVATETHRERRSRSRSQADAFNDYRQADGSIDIFAVLQSAIEQSGRLLRQWFVQVLRDALRSLVR